MHATNEEIMGKVVASAGKGYDVLFVSSPFAEALNKLGICRQARPLQNSQSRQSLSGSERSCKHDPGNTFSVPYTWGTTGLCYRSDLVKAEPTSWNDLLKPSDDLKGKITMLATDRWLMAAAFLALGMSVNTDRSSQARRGARTQLIAAKKNLLAYDDTTFYSKLVSGEAIAGPCLGRLVQLRHRRERQDQIRDPQGRLATSGSTRWSS